MTDDPPPFLVRRGRNPGTSTKVTSRTLNASQVRTKRAAFTEVDVEDACNRECGWLPTIPTEWPPSR